jgi:hypothetical protein
LGAVPRLCGRGRRTPGPAGGRARRVDRIPAATVEQWRDLALAALRKSGAALDTAGPKQVDELLAAETYDGLRIAALHTPG